MGRGSSNQANAGSPFRRDPFANSGPFDPDALEGLGPHEISIGEIIADDDPDPNNVRKCMVSTAHGQWVADFDETDQTWKVDSTPVGPDLERMLNFSRALAGNAYDLRDAQGPNVPGIRYI